MIRVAVGEDNCIAREGLSPGWRRRSTLPRNPCKSVRADGGLEPPPFIMSENHSRNGCSEPLTGGH